MISTRLSQRDCQIPFVIGRGFAEVQILTKMWNWPYLLNILVYSTKTMSKRLFGTNFKFVKLCWSQNEMFLKFFSASLWENLSYAMCEHPRSLITAFVVHCLDSVMPILAKAKISNLCVWTGRFESYLVANSQERFSRDLAHMYYCHSVQIIGCHGNGTIFMTYSWEHIFE